MIDAALHRVLTWTELGLGVLTAASLLFITAPYGRHARAGWGRTLSNRAGWLVMEAPTLLVFVPLYFTGTHFAEPAPLLLLALWLSHYVHRTLVFPFRLRTRDRRMPLSIALTGASFNVLNACVVAPAIAEFGHYPSSWLTDPRMLSGGALFFLGYAINRQADRTLIGLRSNGSSGAAVSGYRVPHGQLFEYVSCPNYLGEILEWIGFAIATWSLAGAAFAFYTAANVGPRALSHHRWYRQTFPDYPKDRRALIPFLL